MRMKSLVGNRYGKLEVRQMMYERCKDGRVRPKCLCSCDCGKEKIIRADSLLYKSVTSCGCDTREKRIKKNRKDLSGMRFGRLVVKEMLWDYRPTRAVCACDCGNESIVISTGLTSGKTTSCGCFQRERASYKNTKDWTGVVSDFGVEFICRDVMNNAGQWLWKCKCGLCRKIFSALPAKVMNGHITSCGCRRRSSREELIENILSENKVDYISQYTTQDCKYKDVLKFDFMVLENSTPSVAIEYDGKQHFTPVEFFGGESSYEETIVRDTIKNQFCDIHGLKMVRIPYTYSNEEIYEKVISAIYP